MSSERIAPLETPEQVEQAARVCHETLRAFCQTLGDNSLPPWKDAPEWQKESSRDGVRFYFEQFAAGIESSPSATHERWMKQKKAEGLEAWRHEESARPRNTRRSWPMMTLPLQEKQKDYLFSAVCKAFYASTAAEAEKSTSRK